MASDHSNVRGRLAGKRAVITGATGGMGRAACRLFCEAGAAVIGSDLPGDRGEALEAELTALGHDFTWRPADVAEPQDAIGLAEAARRQWGVVDILYNNAGIILGKPLLETSIEEWDRLHAVNTRATFLMIKAFAPLMTSGKGSIVNVSSGGGVRALPNMSAYSSSKAGVLMLTKVAAIELAPGIRVNAILPGLVDTNMPRNFFGGLPAGQRQDAWDSLSQGRPLQRAALPEEIVNLALFLASDESSYVTAAEYLIDGGRSA
ncbi:MAG TPA: SDR family NAD(P)-dependent oxidoreductase [Reyranella sp.]|nr:SDR family NAD(P)-dependent oxidoreductase [Reyranella sp.]